MYCTLERNFFDQANIYYKIAQNGLSHLSENYKKEIQNTFIQNNMKHHKFNIIVTILCFMLFLRNVNWLPVMKGPVWHS